MRLPKEYTRYLSLGAEIAATLVIPIGVGYWVDYYFETKPYGILTGSLLGMISFFVMVMRLANRFGNKKPEE